MGRYKWAQLAVVALLFFSWAGLTPVTPEAQADTVTHQTIVVRKGMSLPVPVTESFDRIAVSEPEIADAAPVSVQQCHTPPGG